MSFSPLNRYLLPFGRALSGGPDTYFARTVLGGGEPFLPFAINFTMPRKKVTKSGILPYHIWARSNNREMFNLPTEKMWTICVEQLFNVTIAYGLRVHAFTLMGNHFHLLASTPFSNLGSVMTYFMRETSKKANFDTNRINHLFGSRYKASLIDDFYHYFNVYRYVYQNPLRAGMVKSVELYPYSTISVLFGQSPIVLPLFPSTFDFRDPLMADPESCLKWLNRIPNLSSDRAVAKGLTKTTYSLPIEKSTRKAFQYLPEDLREINALLKRR